MARHLAEEALIAAAEDCADESARAHLETCASCRDRLRGARDGLALCREAGDVPEPPGSYWRDFRREVGERIATEGRLSWAATILRGLRPVLLPAAMVAVLVLALVPARGRVPGGPAPTTLPAWEALPPSEEDGADVLRGLAAQDAGLEAAAECGSLVDCLSDLSDEDSQTVADGLRGALHEGGRS